MGVDAVGSAKAANTGAQEIGYKAGEEGWNGMMQSLNSLGNALAGILKLMTGKGLSVFELR